MTYNMNDNDNVDAMMGAVSFGRSFIIDPSGETYYADGDTAEARQQFEEGVRERLASDAAAPALEAYANGETRGEWQLSQASVNFIIDEAHLAGVEAAVRVLRTADRIEAAWTEFGVEPEVEFGHVTLGGSRTIGGLPLTEAVYTAIIVVELWRHGYAGTRQGCAERRSTFATNFARGIDPFVVVASQLKTNEASLHIRNIKSPVPYDDFTG